MVSFLTVKSTRPKRCPYTCASDLINVSTDWIVNWFRGSSRTVGAVASASVIARDFEECSAISATRDRSQIELRRFSRRVSKPIVAFSTL
ncbi:unnamed protein product [Haemonchus placei]|uniref:Uncharacterized protein n=1 Tax=Haemonchus placei TaxID=6290 RepID=A0A0N4WBJ0_HAEPC|nr:unnamed protein product [Haemonchus placei]